MNFEIKHIRKSSLVSIIGILLVFTVPACGQETDSIDVSSQTAKIFDISFDPVVPVYTFGKDLDKTLYGLTTAFYWERKNKDYSFWGIQLNWAHIDSDRNTYYRGYDEVEDLTSSNFFGIHALFRYYPDFFFWRIEPFAELAFGSNFFTTTTTRYFFDEEGSSDFDFNEFDFGLSYGLGIGFTTQIIKQFFLVTKCVFYSGNSVTYQYKEGTDEIIPFDNFRNESSQANYLRFQFGLSFTFF